MLIEDQEEEDPLAQSEQRKKEEAELAKKGKSLAELLLMMEDYSPIVTSFCKSVIVRFQMQLQNTI